MCTGKEYLVEWALSYAPAYEGGLEQSKQVLHAKSDNIKFFRIIV